MLAAKPKPRRDARTETLDANCQTPSNLDPLFAFQIEAKAALASVIEG
jgi:hypothetical protein